MEAAGVGVDVPTLSILATGQLLRHLGTLSGDLGQDKNMSTWVRDIAGNLQVSILAVKANMLEAIICNFIGYLYHGLSGACS